MRPQSLETQSRIRAAQEDALAEIRLAHEKEGWSPIEPFEVLLPTDEILRKSYPNYVVVDESLPLWRRLLRKAGR